MSYELILTPDAGFGHPAVFISLLHEDPSSTLVVTFDKKILEKKYPDAIYCERGKWVGLSDKEVMNQVETRRPRLILLDHLFFNSELLFDLQQKQKQHPFRLVNMISIRYALETLHASRMDMASQIHFPNNQTQSIERFEKYIGKLRLYNFLENPNPPEEEPIDFKNFELKVTTKPCRQLKHPIDIDRFELEASTKPCIIMKELEETTKQLKHPIDRFELEASTKPCIIMKELEETTKPLKEPESVVSVNKIEYHFYKTLLDSIQGALDLELFAGFLWEIIEEKNNQDPSFAKTKSPLTMSLLDLEYMTRYNKDRYQKTFTMEMKNEYIQQIRPEIKILLKNAPELLEKIRGFFVNE